MICREYKSDLIEIARGRDAPSARKHALTCPACADFLEQQQALSSVLRDLAAEPVEIPVLAGWDKRRFRVSMRAKLAIPLAIAAALLLAWLAIPRHKPQLQPAPAAKPAVSVVAATPGKPALMKPPGRVGRRPAEPRFIQIPYTVPLAPEERAQILRVDMPVAALIAAGLPVEVSDAGAHAEADVIVGEDGRARAIRLISISERSIER